MNTRAAHKAYIAGVQEQSHIQLRFPGLSGIEEEVNRLAEAGVEERGAIFTKREVVEFILDRRIAYDMRVLLKVLGQEEIFLAEPAFAKLKGFLNAAAVFDEKSFEIAFRGSKRLFVQFNSSNRIAKCKPGLAA